MRKLGAVLKEIVFVQRGSEYRFKPHPRLLSYLTSFQVPSDQELWDMSSAIRAPGAEPEVAERINSSRTFLASAISPRAKSDASDSSLPTVGRVRSASITAAFHKWQGKTRGESSSMDEGSVRRPTSSMASPAASPRVSPRPAPPAARSPRETTSPRGGPSPTGKSDVAPEICPVCAASFSTLRALQDHLVKRLCTGQSMKQHTCPVCEVSCATKEELVAHLQARKCTARGAAARRCPLCGEKFATVDLVRAHVHRRECDLTLNK